MKPFGPYRLPNGRLVIVLRKGKKSRTVSYGRYLIEKKLGRRLDRREVVHHIDGNKENNELSNLQVMLRSKHSKLHYVKAKKGL